MKKITCPDCGGYGNKTFCGECSWLAQPEGVGFYCLKLGKDLEGSWRTGVPIVECETCPTCKDKDLYELREKITCKTCGGTGKSPEHDRCVPPNYYDCEPCNGQGHTWQERIPIDVPEGYEFSEIRVVYNPIDLTDYSVAIFNRPTCYVNRVLPHTIGDIKEIECDVCVGNTCSKCGCLLDEHGACSSWYSSEETVGGEERFMCPTCKGTCNLTLTCTSVAVEGREFVIDWRR